MRWLYHLQQRMALTHYESIVLLVIIGFALVGGSTRLISEQLMPIPEPGLPADHAAFAAAAAELNAVFASPATEATTEESEAAPAPADVAEVAPPRPNVSRKAPTARGPVNVNTATLAELDRLPGVGPALAQRIVDYREAHGAFARVASLERVRGIGPKTVAKFDGLAVVE
ncbi:MAG: ComEA family DNA-binding protein [Bacteroidota bacterium]